MPGCVHLDKGMITALAVQMLHAGLRMCGLELCVLNLQLLIIHTADVVQHQGLMVALVLTHGNSKLRLPVCPSLHLDSIRQGTYCSQEVVLTDAHIPVHHM